MPGILVAIDGLPGSEQALRTAVAMAQQDGGQLTAVAVFERSGDPCLAPLVERVAPKARRKMEEVLDAAGNFARSRGVRLTAILREGHPAQAIIDCAEEEQARIVILGSSSRAAAGLGGTADQVSSHAPCTVMIVR